jgi:acyl carrier protein
MTADVRTLIVDFIVSNCLFGDVAQSPADDESLVQSGVIDSTGVLELIEFLEDEFGIEVPEEETVPENLDSIDKLCRYVGSKQLVLQARA